MAMQGAKKQTSSIWGDMCIRDRVSVGSVTASNHTCCFRNLFILFILSNPSVFGRHCRVAFLLLALTATFPASSRFHASPPTSNGLTNASFLLF